MSQEKTFRRKSLLLSIRISLCLIGAAIVPLLITLIISEMQIQPTLINQANTSLETDAKTHAQLIDSYLTSKFLEIKTLSYTPIVLDYLADPVNNQADVPTILANGIAINRSNDPDRMLVTFFDPNGNLLLDYSIYGLKPQPHGKYLIPPEDAQKLAHSNGQQVLSDVYYNPITHVSTMDVYTPIYSLALKRTLGIIRDTLSLNIIANIVNSEKGANGDGSYAFILDENGVRIVDPDPANVFTSIAPLSQQLQQTIKDENRYGVNNTVQTLPDANLANIQGQKQQPVTFQETPFGKTEAFQLTRRPLSLVPWTYFVLTPVNVVVAAANQQLFIFILVALSIFIPVAIIGLIVGNRISTPILRSVETLLANSDGLNRLSQKEEEAASTQLWVVDASRIGLDSIQYYTKALKIALPRLNQLGQDVLQRRNKNRQQVLSAVAQMVNIGQYCEKAVEHQIESNTKVMAAIKVTNEVADQLASGAKSASAAADELERVVNQLRQVVGR